MKKFYTKVKDYFTANSCRKIFFFGVVLIVTLLILNIPFQEYIIYLIVEVLVLIVLGASMIDDMQHYTHFRQQIRDLQYQHFQEIYQKQAAGQNVELIPAFSPQEKKYLNRRKRMLFFSIIAKAALLIVVISLLFRQ